MAPTCATASVRIVGGSTGGSSPEWARYRSFERDVLDADDPLVRLELGDAIHQQKGIAMRQDAFDCRVVERKRQVHVVIASIIRGPRMSSAFPCGRIVTPL